MEFLKSVVKKYTETSLIIRIVIGLVAGAILGRTMTGWTWIGIFGSMFVGALRAVAPVLVFVLIISALSNGQSKLDSKFGLVLFFYMFSTFLAAAAAVVASFVFPVTVASFVFPVTMRLGEAAQSDSVPQNVGEVLQNLLIKMVENPVSAIVNGDYIGILFWAAVLGLAFKKIAAPETRRMLGDAAEAVSAAVRGIINLAPFGICGLVFSTVSEYGLSIFKDYGRLLVVLVGCMMFVALVIDPFIAFLFLKRNPYPLVFRCLRESGITAFFTRSSAANIPVNMELCEKLGLDQDMYSVSIPLGATINMDGAAITITVMTLAAANTLGVHVDIPSALFLSILSTLAACGASGVAGGSLLLIPMACSLFGISNDVAMQVVGVGFIIGVIQDSVETMLRIRHLDQGRQGGCSSHIPGRQAQSGGLNCILTAYCRQNTDIIEFAYQFGILRFAQSCFMILVH